MRCQPKQAANDCPVTRASVATEAKAAFDDLLSYCVTCEAPFWLCAISSLASTPQDCGSRSALPGRS